MDTNNDVMTTKEAAQFLKIGRSTLYKLAQEGKIPGRKVGNSWRFSRKVLNEWLKGDGNDGRPQKA